MHFFLFYKMQQHLGLQPMEEIMAFIYRKHIKDNNEARRGKIEMKRNLMSLRINVILLWVSEFYVSSYLTIQKRGNCGLPFDTAATYMADPPRPCGMVWCGLMRFQRDCFWLLFLKNNFWSSLIS